MFSKHFSHRHAETHRHMHGGFRHAEHRDHGKHRHGRGRMFDHGALRLVILWLIAERPRHGYELIKAIEDGLGGAYAPSPGVIYPTLSLLEEIGHVAASPVESGRKLHSITPEGRAWLAANETALQAALARMRDVRAAAASEPPAVILHALERVKNALRHRLASAPITAEQAEAIADAIDIAAARIERL